MASSLFIGDIGVVLSFTVQNAGDLSTAQQIELLFDGKILQCTIPATPNDVPTYTTTGNENFTPGSWPAQLKITFAPNQVFHTDFFQILVATPNSG